MDIVAEFLNKHFSGFECDSCNRAFPRSLLISLDSPFPEIAGSYCTLCYHKIYDLIGFCDECQEEYPKKYLFKNVFDEQVVCKRCLQKGEE